MVALSNHMLIVLVLSQSLVAAGKPSMHRDIAEIGPLLSIICLQLKQHYIMCNDENTDIQQSQLTQGHFAHCETYKLMCDTRKDNHMDCCEWAKCGECNDNPYFMRVHCKKTCGTCDCKEKNILKCKTNVAENCIGISGNFFRQLTERLKPAAHCQDVNETCSFWADTDECMKNPSFMKMFCQRSCDMCSRKFSIETLPFGVESTGATIKPHGRANVTQFHGEAPQQPGIELQPLDVEPKLPAVVTTRRPAVVLQQQTAGPTLQRSAVAKHQPPGVGPEFLREVAKTEVVVPQYPNVVTLQDSHRVVATQQHGVVAMEHRRTATPQLPRVQPQLPGVQPQLPGVQPQLPGVQPQLPGVQPQLPGVQPQLPGVQPQLPGVQPQLPGLQPQLPGVPPQVPGVVGLEQMGKVVPHDINVVRPPHYDGVVAMEHPAAAAAQLPGVQTQVRRVVVQEQTGAVILQNPDVVASQHSDGGVTMEHHGVVALEGPKVAAPQLHGEQALVQRMVLQERTRAVVPQDPNIVTPRNSHRAETTDNHRVVAMGRLGVATPQPAGVGPRVPRVPLQVETGVVAMKHSEAVAARHPVVVVAHPRQNGKTDQKKPDCVDAYNLCAAWKQRHECHKNPAWMSFYCRKSCGWCLA